MQLLKSFICIITQTTYIALIVSGIIFCNSDNAIQAPTDKPYCVCYIETDSSYWDFIENPVIFMGPLLLDAYLAGDPVPNSFNVRINDTLPKGNVSSEHFNMGLRYNGTFRDQSYIEQKRVTVQSDFGINAGTIRIPDKVIVTSDYHNDTVTLDQEIMLEWVGNADWYHVIARALDVGHRYRNYFDTTIVGYKAQVPLDYVDDAIVSLHMTVIGVNGPIPEQSSFGNMKGPCEGFLYAFWSQRSGGANYNSVYIKDRSFSEKKVIEDTGSTNLLKEKLQRFHYGN